MTVDLTGLLPADQQRVLLDLVRTTIAEVLAAARPGEAAPAIEGEKPLRELGIDSLAVVDLHGRLVRATGLALPVTIAFDHPTPAALAAHLRDELLSDDSVEQVHRRVEVVDDDPVVIVGIGCRFPGADSAEQLWDLVAAGEHVLTDFPADRGWDLASLFDPDPAKPGASYVRHGGFIDTAAEFDADFFGISPREAAATDPQQRLVLETSWHALESAGIDPTGLRGAPVGVFVGAEPQEYGPRLFEAPDGLDAHLLTGAAPSVVSGRVAYLLGLRGPAITLDTACSASLVAVHMACRALRQGEVGLALAGGVAIMGSPGTFNAFSRQRGLAPDGRCKAFAAAADGTGFAEGVGILVLERLSDARRAGRPVLAVIRGSAINSDGASNGLTAPSGAAQRQVIHAALADAGLTPGEVDAVEAHGTGTTLGDPIEAQALLAVYGRDRPAHKPLRLGSLKSNIGHTQAAAGVAGVIKMVHAMRNGLLPRTLHVDEPSPHVDWSAGAVELLTTEIAWDDTDHPRRAGVSSFGISGTNAHLILEQAPPGQFSPAPYTETPVLPWVLSARGGHALRAMADDLVRATEKESAVDIGGSLAAIRASLSDRAVLIGRDAEELRAAASVLASGGSSVVTGKAGRGGLALLFTGQGSQRVGAGRELYRQYPVFAEALDDACGYLDLQLDRPLRDLLLAEPGSADDGLLDDTGYAQPALFAIEVALYRLIESWGVRPDRLVGHSIGELAAAHIAGVLSLDDAATLVAARGRLMSELPAGGVMVSVEATEETVLPLLDGQVSIAALNEPSSVVLSGDADAVRRVAADLAAAGHRTKELRVSHAFHSHLMDPMLTEFRRVAEIVTYNPPQIPIVSTMTGRLASADELCSPEYWVGHVRQPVRFSDSVRTLAEMGVTVFLELGPDGVLSGMGQATLPQDAVFAAGMRRDRPEAITLMTAVATAYAHGADVDWTKFYRSLGARAVPLPHYPFQRKRFWLAPGVSGTDAAGLGMRDAGHPLLGGLTEVAGGTELILTGRVSTQTHSWLADHVISGTVLFPGTAFVEMALHAGERAGCPSLLELTLQAPLALGEGEAVVLQTVVGAERDDDVRPVTIFSRPATGSGTEWTCHGSGLLGDVTPPAEPTPEPWLPPAARPVGLDGHYDDLASQGYQYGPAFRGLRAAWVHGADVYAEIALPGSVADDGFGVHPALMDAVLHAIGLGAEPDDEVKLPFAWSGVRLHAEGATTVRVRVSPGESGARLDVTDMSGAPVFTVESFVERAVPVARLSDPLLRVDWVPVAPSDVPAYVVVDPTAHAIAALPDTPDFVITTLDTELGADVPGGARAVTGRALEILQAWLAGTRFAAARLVLILSEGLGAGPVRALVRSAQAEHPGRIVLAVGGTVDDVLPALASGQPELAVRGGVGHRPVVVRATSEAELAPPVSGAWRVDVTDPGTADGLNVIPAPEAAAALKPGQVRVAVRAAGVNFRDVLMALGMYPGRGDIGGEAAGVVAEVGPDVTGLAVGDRVLGLFDTAFGPFAVTDHRLLAKMPDGWTFARAAAEPIAYATAYRGLVDLAGVRRAERVLIHAAAGGVGMAAVKLARRLGAEVFGTASPAKWDTLRELGLDDEHIASSRDTAFADKFGHVDVVLNALAGEFVDASLRLLPDGGRFVEMGKTDIRSPEQIPPGVRYEAFDVMDAGPDRLAEILATLDADTPAPPLRSWDVRRARDAFRHMALARHTGKIVLTMPPALDPDGTVLITGGTAGLGAQVARHLVTHNGVRRLLLLARGEAPADLIDGLTSLGAEVTTAQCDVADPQSLAAAVKSADRLTAVVHAAGVVDDAVLTSLDAERLDRVFRPKVDGSWHLHELTRGHDLAAFVMFSSVAGTFDGVGQGNYAAANGFQEELARVRRAAGLPATALAWGPWDATTGMVSRMAEADVARMTRSGVRPLAVSEGLAMLDAALTGAEPDPVLLPVALDLPKMRERTDMPGILAGLVGQTLRRRRTAAGVPETSFADMLAQMPPEQQDQALLDLVTTHTAAVLGHDDRDAIDPRRGFTELGFDSLTAVEFRNRLNNACGVTLPVTLVFDYPNATAVAGLLRADLIAGKAVSVEEEFARIAKALERLAEGGADRAAIVTGLRTLTGRWSEQNGDAALTSVTASELFDILDAELETPE